MKDWTGGCRCGAVRYEVEGKPTFQVTCHCRDCQYASGGAPAHTVILPSAGFRITKGEPRGHTVLSEAGTPVERLFCGECGTPLFARNDEHPELIVIKVGSLNDPGQFRPRAEIWVRSAQPWALRDPAVPQISGNPKWDGEALLALGKASLVRLGRKLVLAESRPAVGALD
jgi:hypothetical protein